MYKYASKAPPYNGNIYQTMYVPTVSGIESTMAWLDSLARRHYLTTDSTDAFVGDNGFNWRRFYDENSSELMTPVVAPPYELEGYPMYVSGFWNQFKVASKLIGRQIGHNLDNRPYPNVSNAFMWSGNAVNPDAGYGTLPIRRDVNENLFDVGQIPKTYYETYIARNNISRVDNESVGFMHTIGRRRFRQFDGEPIVLRISVTHTQNLSIIRDGDFVAREITNPTLVGGLNLIDFDAAPPFDMEALNSNWGRDIGPIEWTVFYEAIQYSGAYDIVDHYDLIDGGWTWDGTDTVPASTSNDAGGPKYLKPQNVDSSGYSIERYNETFCDVESYSYPVPFSGSRLVETIPNGWWFPVPMHADSLEPTEPATSPVYPRDGYPFTEDLPSFRFDVTGRKNCAMNHYAKYSSFAVGESSTYDITRHWGLASDAEYDFLMRHHKRIGGNLGFRDKIFGRLCTDRFYTNTSYYNGDTSITNRQIVAASPMFSGGRGDNLFELEQVENGQYYPVGGVYPASHGSGRFFNDLNIESGFLPAINDHNADGYYLTVASFIDPSGNYEPDPQLLYTSRGGNGRYFYFCNGSNTTLDYPTVNNVYIRSPLTPVSGVMKISGVVVAEGRFDQYKTESTYLTGPGGGPYLGFFNMGDVAGAFGLKNMPISGCYDDPYNLGDPQRHVNYNATFPSVPLNKFQFMNFAGTKTTLSMGAAGGGSQGEIISPVLGAAGAVNRQQYDPVTRSLHFKGVLFLEFSSSVNITNVDGATLVPSDPLIKRYEAPEWTRYSQCTQVDYQVQSISRLSEFPNNAHQNQSPFEFVNFVRPSSYLRCLNGYVDINAADNLFPQSGEYPVDLGDGEPSTIPAFYTGF